MKIFHLFNILTLLIIPGYLSAAPLDFEKDIQPILKDHCVKCHGRVKPKAKIRYDDAKYFKEHIGTHEHAVVVPGKPEQSKMLKLASLPPTDTSAMPPPRERKRGAKPLNATEIAKIRQWITEGAKLDSQAPASEATSTTVPATAPDRNAVHNWTNKNNGSLPAVFVSVFVGSDKKKYVKLRKMDGENIDYPIEKLSDQSKALLNTLAPGSVP